MICVHKELREMFHITVKTLMLTFFVVDFALFLLYVTENELATPPLDGIILPGVTRQSILDLARNWVSFFGHASSGFNSRKIY